MDSSDSEDLKDYSNSGISEFPPKSEIEMCSSLIFSNNPISSFFGLPSLAFLQSLYLDNTKIQNFQYVQQESGLSVLSMIKTPLSKRIYFTEMALLCFNNLKELNGKKVNLETIKFVKSLPKALPSYIRNGWLLTETDPPTIYDPETGASIEVNSKTPSCPQKKIHTEQKESKDAKKAKDLKSKKDLEESKETKSPKKIKGTKSQKSIEE